MPSNLRAFIRRDQLAKFLPDNRSIREFEKLFTQNDEIISTVENIIAGVGLNTDGTYDPISGSNYLDLSTSFLSAILILDNTAGTTKVSTVISNTQLEAESISLIVDATTSSIDITLPNPALCINEGRSYRISVTKKDSTNNYVNIKPNDTESVVFSAFETLELQGEVMNFITDGTDWYLDN